MRNFPTIASYARALIQRVARVDEDGRNIGLPYDKMLRLIRRNFPVVTYPGPHLGKPIRLTVKDLKLIAFHLRQNNSDLRLPFHPPKKRARKRRKS